MATSAQTKATTKYIKERQTTFTFRCHNEKDADLIEFLRSQGNVSGYLKKIVREKIRANI